MWTTQRIRRVTTGPTASRHPHHGPPRGTAHPHPGHSATAPHPYAPPHRKPPLVPVDLRVERRQRVDAEHLAQLEQIRQHVRHLVRDTVRGVRVVHDPRRLLGRQPLEDLDQLGRLHAERGDQVLRRVVLLPVPRGSELGQPALQLRHIQFTFTHGVRSTTVTPAPRTPGRPRPPHPPAGCAPLAHPRRQPHQLPGLPHVQPRSRPSASTVSVCSAAGTSPPGRPPARRAR